MRNTTLHFKGLNGIRAIAALCVVACHVTEYLSYYNLELFLGKTPNGHPVAPITGMYGVTIFFSLSGFLITYLLLAEKDAHPIQIKKFYWRRILRIWPLYYLYLLVTLTVLFLFHTAYSSSSLPFYLFYAANIPYVLRKPIPFVEHFWSLGTEEQFYLFWPWLVEKVRSNHLKVIAAIIAAIVGVKLILHFVFALDISQIVIDAFPFHCMMIGAVGAILYKQKNRLFLALANHKISQAIAWLFVLSIIVNKYHIASIVDKEIIAVVALVIIIGQIEVRNRLVNLELKFLDFLGRISYGIYVFHPLVIFLTSYLIRPLVMPVVLKYIVVYCAVVGLTILLAFLSYRYFESYFLRLKEKFSPLKPAGAVPLSKLVVITQESEVKSKV